MSQPVWETPPGSLGTIPEGVFYSIPILATEPTNATVTSVAGTGSAVTLSFTSAIAVTSAAGNGLTVTLSFPTQPCVLFDIGSNISVTGFTPVGLNGTYTVTASTTSSVSYSNTTNTVRPPVTVTCGSVTSLSKPFPAGSKISVSGFSPEGYNGTFTVTAATTNSVTVANTTTAPVTTYGTISLTVYYQLVAGALPKGMQINESGIIAGIPKSGVNVQGIPSDVAVDTFSKFAIRAYTRVGAGVGRLADRTFTIEIANTTVPQFVTPPGQIAQLFDASLITDLQVKYEGPDNTIVLLASGSLPPGLTIDTKGKISGLINLLSLNTNYQFTLEVTDGTVGGTTLRAFSIYVWSRSCLSADTTYITADNTFITADGTPILIPVLLNPEGSIGTTRSDNFFAYQFNGIDLSGDQFRYLTDANIPGLTLDPNSGWLYGDIPPLGLNNQVFSFNVYLQLVNYPDYLSLPYSYSLTVTGPVNSDIVWITPSYLGSIDNGATSTFYVEAVSKSGLALQYQLLSGSDSRLPQGLKLLPNGDIAGRVSFDTFALDGGTTIFDSGTTTFDMVCTFTVNAFSGNGLVNVNQVFSIRVNRAYNEPYDNLYIQAMPPTNDRVIINKLLQNTNIFQQDLLYRPTDPNFGVATNVIYYHAYGLTAATLDDYVSSLDINHYWKNLVLGSIEVAQAINSAGEVVYEVVYSRVIDDLVNAQGESVSKDVRLPYPVTTGDAAGVTNVYPNSLINMRDQVIDTVGQISNVLPLWMLCQQANGQTLGFTPAWVIAYAKPGRGQQIAYYLGEDFIEKLNTIEFEVDRYELDNLLTKNWNRKEQYWGPPHPAAATTFDRGITTTISGWVNDNYETVSWINATPEIVDWSNSYNGQPTVFDGNSLQFIAPVDMYSHTQEYDKYLVFPRRNILE